MLPHFISPSKAPQFTQTSYWALTQTTTHQTIPYLVFVYENHTLNVLYDPEYGNSERFEGLARLISIEAPNLSLVRVLPSKSVDNLDICLVFNSSSKQQATIYSLIERQVIFNVSRRKLVVDVCSSNKYVVFITETSLMVLNREAMDFTFHINDFRTNIRSVDHRVTVGDRFLLFSGPEAHVSAETVDFKVSTSLNVFSLIDSGVSQLKRLVTDNERETTENDVIFVYDLQRACLCNAIGVPGFDICMIAFSRLANMVAFVESTARYVVVCDLSFEIQTSKLSFVKPRVLVRGVTVNTPIGLEFHSMDRYLLLSSMSGGTVHVFDLLSETGVERVTKFKASLPSVPARACLNNFFLADPHQLFKVYGRKLVVFGENTEDDLDVACMRPITLFTPRNRVLAPEFVQVSRIELQSCTRWVEPLFARPNVEFDFSSDDVRRMDAGSAPAYDGGKNEIMAALETPFYFD
ncbi:hypothetical protein PCE1_004311 [Barthelona sp. PCE]